MYIVFLLSGGLHVADRNCVLTLSSKRCYNLYDTLFITFFLPILRWYHDMRFYFLVTEEKALATLWKVVTDDIINWWYNQQVLTSSLKLFAFFWGVYYFNNLPSKRMFRSVKGSLWDIFHPLFTGKNASRRNFFFQRFLCKIGKQPPMTIHVQIRLVSAKKKHNRNACDYHFQPNWKEEK